MWKKFKFDYDSENDDLFLYDSNSKSKGSIEIDDIVIDFDSKMNVSGIELMKASQFFNDLDFENISIDKELLSKIKECKIEIVPKSNFFVIKLLLLLESNREIKTPIIIPRISKPSPAIV